MPHAEEIPSQPSILKKAGILTDAQWARSNLGYTACRPFRSAARRVYGSLACEVMAPISKLQSRGEPEETGERLQLGGGGLGLVDGTDGR